MGSWRKVAATEGGIYSNSKTPNIMDISNITANGASASGSWGGGKGNLTLGGDFGGGHARVEFSKDSGTTWFPLEFSFRRNQAFTVELPACDVRVFVVDAITPILDLNLESI